MTITRAGAIAIAWACGLAFVAACGRDVALGQDVAIDAAVDAPSGNGNPFAPGDYGVRFLSPSTVNCDGTLVGSEASFQAIAPADVGFVAAVVTLATPTSDVLTVSGSLIATAWSMPSLSLQSDQTAPPAIWETIVPSSGGGPMNTERLAAMFGVDSSTAAASVIEAQAGIGYFTSDMMGTCTITFGAALAKQ